MVRAAATTSALLLLAACKTSPPPPGVPPSAADTTRFEMAQADEDEDDGEPEDEGTEETAEAGTFHEPGAQEEHLGRLHQLTFGGENAEAYLSFDETRLVFQSTRDGAQCDQIFTMGLDGSGQTRVSTGKGRTTCAYFLPGDAKILYASTHAAEIGRASCRERV